MIKPDLAIVNSIQPHLRAVVKNLDPWGQLTVVVTDAHNKHMGPLPFAIHCQLCKDCTDLQQFM